ncbi:MAG: T9SS type A sorting domain-containing protein [Candidatus Electryonea clarkiae]|nr:T9SS type A sorting domain-containing protein [Candidatus Electryonea clarkiae]MDP8286679.1 T9SS type A sorting domain-containing protein [Candidatus Electryonea clarkiae]
MHYQRLPLMSVLLLALSFSLQADIIRIPEDNNSIQDAIDESEQGDTLLIAPGEYEERLEIEDHGLTLASEYLFDQDTTIIEETILSGGDSFRILTIDSLGTDTVNIIGLTFAYGRSGEGGGGIRCEGAKINLYNNVIRDNNASYSAGVYLNHCFGTIQNNRITDNESTGSVGGISVYSSQMLVVHNTFFNNSSSTSGGGMRTNTSNLIIRENLFDSNSAPRGGGLALVRGELLIENNIFRNNHADGDNNGAGAAINLYGNNRNAQPIWMVIVRNNLFYENISDEHGGGMYIAGDFADLEVYGNRFEGNQGEYGGTIFFGSDCDLYDNLFINNHSPRSSIFTSYSGPTINCYNSVFLNNGPIDEFVPNSAAAATFANTRVYISNCDFLGNIPAAVGFLSIEKTGTITAENCYWGDPSGPYHPIENEEGLGDSVDSAMDEEDFIPFSRQPISASFNLATPDSGTEQNESPVNFSWFPSVDYLTGDSIIHYSLEIYNSITELDSLNFEGAEQHNAGTDTFITIALEDFERFYYWRVIAEGEHMPPTISTDTSMFILSDGLAPNSFDLGEPENFEINNEAPVLFTWHRTTDPTPGDTIQYMLEIATNHVFDSSRVYPVDSDTFLIVDEFDYENTYLWQVYAEDRVHHRTYSTESRAFYFSNVNDPDFNEIPGDWELVGIYPIPFNSSLTVVVGLPHRNDLFINIYDLLGREVAVLLNQTVDRGYRQFSFDAGGMASGIYFLNISAPGKFNKMSKIVLVK